MKTLIVFFFVFFFLPPVVSAKATFTVSKVIDGDTLKISNGDIVKLVGVNTPVIRDLKKNKANAAKWGMSLKQYKYYAKRARAFTAMAVKGQTITVSLDDRNNKIRHRDKEKRLLGYVRVLDFNKRDFTDEKDLDWRKYVYPVISKSGKLHLNETIVNSGFGVTDMKSPFKFQNRFAQFQEDSKNDKRGIWK